MLAFDARRAPQELAQALLALADPLPALKVWSLEPPAALAPVLHALKDELRAGATSPVLRELPLDLSLGDRAIHLDLLLLPSIFPPEAWGMTFLEGLLRKPLRDYAGQRMVELGTGSGWVALALLRFTELERVLGVDLNPQAVLISRMNAILNGYDAHGVPTEDRLAERFESAESDLLGEPRRRGFRARFVVGCIPQVIAPESKLEAGSDAEAEGLYDLSNYFLAQGLVEDQFGLGLNARALRESLLVLEPEGRILLNLAGRPGPQVVRRMFLRRGFEPEVLWRTRVRQASDTDIRPLVELEARTGSPFAFHLHRQSPESVSARVAQAALEGGLPIFHELQVIEGRPRSEALFALARALEHLGLEELWERVDLSGASEEQLAFVLRLAEGFHRDPRAPYAHEAGDPSFRKRVADFLRKFHDLPLGPEELFAAPNRAELLHALLISLVEPGEQVALSRELLPAFEGALAKAGVDAVALHGDPEEIAELLPCLRPRLVLLSGALAANPASLAKVLGACEALGSPLLLDASEGFVIGSQGPEHPVLRFLQRHRAHPLLGVLVGLIHSQAFPDVELSLLLCRPRRLHLALEAAAELTYSRLSHFHQAYYEALFDELLSFRVNEEEPYAEALPDVAGPRLRPLMEALLETPPFARPAPDADVIRLDYGENELALPRQLQLGILQGFLAEPQSQPMDAPVSEAARHACAAYLRATRLPRVKDAQVHLGMGTLPLLFDALRALRTDRPLRVLLPRGSYGLFAPLVAAAGAEVHLLETQAPHFLAEPGAVAAAAPFDLLLLTHPANPSGASYAPGTLRELIRLASRRGARVVVDEVFGLLGDLEGELPLGQDRWGGLDAHEAKALLLLCGASKEFAAGGLRLGLAASADAELLQGLRAQRLGPLPRSIQVAAQVLFEDLDTCFSELRELRGSLAARRRLLAEGLRELSFGLDGAAGGLFLFPDVAGLDGDPEAFVLRLEREARVRLNTPAWSGTPSRARACFALPEARLREALGRLRAYLGA